MELLVIFILLFLNGLFAMYEIALVSSRKFRLEEKARFGNKGAAMALKLLQKPENILSAIQVGITLIGIFAGAYGGVAIAEDVAPIIAKIPVLASYADTIALILIVGFITYLSLIIGELVPKTLALNNPEIISSFFSPGMKVMGSVFYPVVWILALSTKLVLKIFGVKSKEQPPVTEEELRYLLKKGSESGIIEKEESEIITEVMRFADRRASHIMIQRMDVKWLDINADLQEIVDAAVSSDHMLLPVCKNNIDDIKGIVNVKDLLAEYVTNKTVEIEKLLTEPLFIPERVLAVKILELFRKTKKHFGVVVDEYGSMVGIITLHDLAENIMGELPGMTDVDEPEIFQREDGSFIIDGLMKLDVLKDLLGLYSFFEPDEEKADIHTVGGLAMHKLNKVPHAGNIFTIGHYRFEIIDMDGTRVDKVLVNLKSNTP
ncbi:MAG: HlyC/CorC family transporter [Bacteroidales bacterium]|nr:HlyC/CorC family transporter [Bacteroidales bacterium]MBN2761937.1 HlyC/CorC family transporter [Bacteroidales bacterium]